MSSALNKAFAELRRRLPEPEVVLVPGEAFYTTTFAIPSGMEPADLEAFVELSLEEVSPFPLDQLTWGFLAHEDSPHVLAYATPLSRLRQLGIANIEGPHHLLPSFAALFGHEVKQPVVEILRNGDSLTVLWREPGQSVPRKAASKLLREAEDPHKVALRLCLQMGAPKELLANEVMEVSAIELDVHGRPIFQIKGQSRQERHIPPWNGTRIWQADVRDVVFSQAESSRRRRGERLWLGLQGLTGGAVILLALQLVVWGFGWWNTARAETVTGREEEVARIENNHDLMLRLEQFAQEEMRPFDMMEIINQERSAPLHFERVSGTSRTQMRIDGEADSVQLVNRFVEKLLANANISAVDTERQISRRNRAEFTILVTFANVPDLLGEELEARRQERLALSADGTVEAEAALEEMFEEDLRASEALFRTSREDALKSLSDKELDEMISGENAPPEPTEPRR